MEDKETITEKEWEAHGLKCKVLFVRQTHRCGYVGVPKSHIAFDKDYDDLPIDVHGGLTYADREKDGLCWFGFDCAHYMDKVMWPKELNLHNHKREHFWSLEEVTKETENMAKQLTQLTLRKIITHKMRWMPNWFKDNVTIKLEVRGEQNAYNQRVFDGRRVCAVSNPGDRREH